MPNKMIFFKQIGTISLLFLNNQGFRTLEYKLTNLV